MAIIEPRGPIWFYKADVLIQFLGALIALLIAYYSYKSYKLSSKKTHLYFSTAFFFLSLSLLVYSVVLPFVAIYYIGSAFIANLITIENLVIGSRIFNFIFIFSYLFAYLLLLIVYSKYEKKRTVLSAFIASAIAAAILLIAYISYSSATFIVFNLINLVLLLIISKFTYKAYKQKKNKNTYYALLAFILLAVSHFLLLFNDVSNIFFLSAHVIQLIGYLSLLTVYYKAIIYK